MNDQIKAAIRAYADGRITRDQLAMLENELQTDSTVRETFLRELNLVAALEDAALEETAAEASKPLARIVDGPISGADASAAAGLGVGAPRAAARSSVPRQRTSRWLLVALTATAATLLAALFFQWTDTERPIATITGVSGASLWTGDRGRMQKNLAVGTALGGGTIEGTAHDSWVELEFRDGSTATISGNSMLTFSENGQKQLRLKSGRLAANVQPQPSGKPMVIHTRTATLEVLGTRLDVQTDLASTTLNVNEGRVRATRISDGSSVEVPSDHRLVAATDHQLAPFRVPKIVDHWTSRLDLGPRNTFGKWLAADGPQKEARLKSIPFQTEQNTTIYATSIDLSTDDGSPVVSQPGTRIRIRGRIDRPHALYFGITVRRLNGEFAGRFQTILPAEELAVDRDFDVTLELADFQFDPALDHLKAKLPADHIGMEIDTVWAHSLYDYVGLEVMQIEFLSASNPKENI